MWKPVVGYEGTYEVSAELQQVRSLDRVTSHGRRIKGTTLKVQTQDTGYKTVMLYKGQRGSTRSLHTIIAKAFIGPAPEGKPFVLHRDDDKANNTLSNLYYGTSAENCDDMVRNGTHRQIQKSHCPQGHLLEAPNLMPSQLRRGQRACLACNRAHAYARSLRVRGITPNMHELYARYYSEVKP